MYCNQVALLQNEKFILIINIVLLRCAVCTVPPATSIHLGMMMMILLRNIHFAALYRNEAIDIQSKKFICARSS
jgi:hypothetical protein